MLQFLLVSVNCIHFHVSESCTFKEYCRRLDLTESDLKINFAVKALPRLEIYVDKLHRMSMAAEFKYLQMHQHVTSHVGCRRSNSEPTDMKIFMLMTENVTTCRYRYL